MHTGPVPADGGRDEDPAWRALEPEDWQPVVTRPDDSFIGASEDELLGVLRAWDRVEAHAAARKFAAVAELMRRRPAPGKVLEGRARMPAECGEFTVCELVTTLALSRWDADDMMSFATTWRSGSPAPGPPSLMALSIRKGPSSSSGRPRC
jgi:hypothetical protein